MLTTGGLAPNSPCRHGPQPVGQPRAWPLIGSPSTIEQSFRGSLDACTTAGHSFATQALLGRAHIFTLGALWAAIPWPCRHTSTRGFRSA